MSKSLLTTRTLKVRIRNPDPRLGDLQRQAANVYNIIKDAHWAAYGDENSSNLTKFASFSITKDIECDLGARSKQLAASGFYDGLQSFFALKKSGAVSDPKPPHKDVAFRPIEFDLGIALKDGFLRLPLKLGVEPILVPWKMGKPKTAKIVYEKTQRCYFVCATYNFEMPQEPEVSLDPTKVAAVDQGEVHLVTYASSSGVVIVNGRGARSNRRYRNKMLGNFESRLSKCKDGSRRRRKLVRAKHKALAKVNNRIKDDVHKATAAAVALAKSEGIETIVIGDIRGIRKGNNKGKKINQKVHQAPFDKVRSQLTYKAKAQGMRVELISEAYTSQTCPACGDKNKPKGRIYRCECGFTYHRDAVGASNIRTKYLKKSGIGTSVVGVLAPPIRGINPSRLCSSQNLVTSVGWFTSFLEDALSEKP